MEYNHNIKKPSKLVIIISSIILVVSIVFSICIVINTITKFKSLYTESKNSILVPDMKEINFDEPGKYTIFLQTRGMAMDGYYFTVPEDINGLRVRIHNGNNELNVYPVNGDIRTTLGSNEYVGVLEFEIDTPGNYQVETERNIDQNSSLSLTIQKSNFIFKLIGGIFLSIFSIAFGVGIFVISIIYWTVKNNRYKREAEKNPLFNVKEY